MTSDEKIDALVEYLAVELARLQGQFSGIDHQFNTPIFEAMLKHYRDQLKAVVAGEGQVKVGLDGTYWAALDQK